ncbi:cystatin-like [Erpetoichthys calabaricus]|nr:cystatin-like [Erpetoichthys calabaricus]
MAGQWKTVACLLGFMCAIGAVASARDGGGPPRGRMTGGLRPANTNNAQVASMLDFAVSEHNKKSNDMYFHKVSRIVSAHTQVVAGLKYYIEAEIERTTCKKGSGMVENTLDECATHDNPELSKKLTCTFEIWTRPWIPLITLEKEKCL